MYLIQDKLKIILIFISYKFTSGVHGKQNKNTIYYKIDSNIMINY